MEASSRQGIKSVGSLGLKSVIVINILYSLDH